MPDIRRLLSSFIALADTAYGAALNTTAVPDWRDLTGNKWRISAGRLIAADGSQQFLRPIWWENRTDARHRNGKIVLRLIWDSSKDWNFILRYRYAPAGAYAAGIQLYINLAGGIGLYYADKGNNGALPALSGNGVAGESSMPLVNLSGLVNGTEYWFEFECRGESGVGAGEQVKCNSVKPFVAGALGAALNCFPGATSSYTWNIPNTSFTGDATIPLWSGEVAPDVYMLRSRNGTYTGVEILTEGTYVATSTGYYRLQARKNSLKFYHQPNGTEIPMNVEVKYNGNHLVGSPAVYNGNRLEFSLLGLQPDTVYQINVNGTNSVGATYGAALPFVTLRHDIPEFLDILGLGDSISVGGNPKPIQVANSYLMALLGIAASEAHAMGTSGYTTAQITASIPDIVNVINAAPGNTQGATRIKRIIFIRLGKNDHNQNGETNAEAAARSLAGVQLIVDAIRAQCAHNPVIFICPITMSGAEGPGSRIRLTNALFAAMDNPTSGIYYEGDFSSNAFAWDTALLSDEVMVGVESAPDFVHPDQDGINYVLGRQHADAYIERVIEGQPLPGSSGSGAIALGSRQARRGRN